MDGLVLSAGFYTSPELGLATLVSISLHEIPQEIGDLVLLYSGLKPRRALLLNLATSLTSLAGVGAYALLGGLADSVTPYLLAWSFGNFLYIAGADLVPVLKEEKSLTASLGYLAAMAAGVGLLYWLAL